MFGASHNYSALCITANRQDSDQLSQQFTKALPEYNLHVLMGLENGLQHMSKIPADQHVAQIVLAFEALEAAGVEVLQRFRKAHPEAYILLYGKGQVGDWDTAQTDAVYRIIREDIASEGFVQALMESARLYEQNHTLQLKSRILSELHRASMSLTGETDLHQLQHKLMRIVLDNSNANDIYILLEDSSGELKIRAHGSAGDYDTETLEQIISDFSPVCPGIVEYVSQNLETVNLLDATSDELFGSNPYIRKNRCQSIICSPMVYQGKILGLMYLENAEQKAAFNTDNLEFLKLLSATAAIAIQNATSYGELERRVEERTREVMQQKDEIERHRDEVRAKNNETLASLRYARRIQQAVLPDLPQISTAFPKSFVYYEPKDIVSGDFYWFSQRLSKTIIAAADCTGHGVPGAFMTIMANTILKQVVELEGTFNPGEILAQLHLRIRVALKQGQENGETQNDGLDTALCMIDTKRMKLAYAGANRPLLLIRHNEVFEYKPEKYGVGGDMFEHEARTYETHELDLQPGDSIYIYSDGFVDQIGGESDKRYGHRRFKEFVLSIQSHDLEHQRLLLEAEMQHWQDSNPQMDDMLVIGIRF